MIHESIREYLEHTKIAEKDLADKLGISIPYMNLLKQGKRRPSPELAQKIEALTGIPFRKLLLTSENDAA